MNGPSVVSGNPSTPGLMPTIVAPSLLNLSAQQVFTITGRTLDAVGNPLGTCALHLFRTADDAVIRNNSSSDASGNYSLVVAPGVTHYLVAYKAGSPDVEGTTVNTLVGT
jgi:hypothetical protein